MMMKNKITVVLLSSFLLTIITTAAAAFDSAGLLNDDVLGLTAFKSGMVDPTSALSSWNPDADSPCSWNFVSCDPTSSRVSSLSLDGLSLSGTLSSARALRNLPRLRSLSLSRNNLSGPLPPSLALLLPALRSLDLSRNALSGPLPASLDSGDGTIIANCSLRFLSLAGNSLEGPVPAAGTFLRKCGSLRSLDLSGNRLSGQLEFAGGIWRLARLRMLDLSGNAFSGPVPGGVARLHFLKELRLQGNRFSGPLPADIGLCPHLHSLDFGDNMFAGPLPESLSRLSSLASIRLSNNLLEGDFPQWIGNMTGLERVDFAGNGFSGALPPSVGALQSLKFLNLSENKLTGNIPASLVDCAQLSAVWLGGNNFSGGIPSGLFDLGLEELDLSANQLTGPIPPGSSRLYESLRRLDLSKNSLTGSIPAEMGLLSNLRYLNLSWNSLHSRLPPEFGYLQNLTVLDLRNTSLFGSIPGDICDSGKLNVLQLDGNSLTGIFPEEMGNCSSLYLLSLSHNKLYGLIPRSISKLSKLRILLLEFNQLSGEIPQELGKLENLLAANVSYNRLIGRLPVGGIFQSLDQSALQGNLGICSPLLMGPCKMNVPKPLVLDPNAVHRTPNSGDQPSKATKFQHRHFLSITAIAAISAASVIAIAVILVSLLNFVARRRPAFTNTALESSCSSSISSSGTVEAGRLVLFESNSSQDWVQLEPSMLDKAAEIGTGVLGSVYKVQLGGEGETVAIRRLVSTNIVQHPDDFDREVRLLGKARHPNLIMLSGYQWTPQMQLLVSEYAPHGSLQARLHERPPSTPSLSWPDRFKTLLGLAKGLAHLHHSVQPPIIHYNIKPSNILFDEHYNPKISDFGLARLVMKLDKHTNSTRFQGSLGYTAPELTCQSSRVSEKCDVYGFGMVVLELVTGRRPVEYGEASIVMLSDHVRTMLEQGNVLECVDLSMGSYSEDEVLPILKLGLVCTSQVPSSRPSMAEVVQILQVIKTPVQQKMEMF